MKTDPADLSPTLDETTCYLPREQAWAMLHRVDDFRPLSERGEQDEPITTPESLFGAAEWCAVVIVGVVVGLCYWVWLSVRPVVIAALS